jgi:DNA uptake protein ComE-like DNA-binding protein
VLNKQIKGKINGQALFIMNELSELISKFGFPIIAAAGMAGFVYYVWTWVTTEIKPVIGQANGTLIALIDRIRMLDNDLIRLNQKVETVMELRGKTIERERIEAEKDINTATRKELQELPIGKRRATAKEISEAAGND